MIDNAQEDILGWASRLDTVIANTPGCVVRHAVVVDCAASTMDTASSLARGESGLLVVASRQTHGRGSRGRSWDDGDRKTLPCTFVLDPGGTDAPMLAACVACAVHEALGALSPASVELKIKWPNDIVVRSDESDRKLAGVLIERRNGLTLVGIGVNCAQRRDDWDEDLRGAAVSLGELNAPASRLDVACRLIQHLSCWFTAHDRGSIRDYYRTHDAMTGTTRIFRVGRTLHCGVVESIDPLECITIETPAGRRTFPVAQTTHIGGEERRQGRPGG